MAPTPHAGTKLTDLAMQCQDHCMGPDGPGGALKSQVDQWRGGLRASLWIVGLLFAVSVGVSVTVIPALVDAKITRRLDERFGKMAGPVAAPSAFINQAHAETKGTP